MSWFKLRRFVLKWTHYEYWPWLFFYIPVVPYYLYLTIKARWFFYSTAANPGIDLGGLFGESKIDILNHFSEEFKPKTFFHTATSVASETINEISNRSFEFPVIAKPNIGERGDKVEKIESKAALQAFLETTNADFIIQEYVDYPIELGVLYGRQPNEQKGSVRSIVMKRFLTVTGDGKQTVKDLLLKNPRAWFQIERLEIEKQELLNSIPESGVEVMVEPIGNHCRGTEFINANHLINENVNAVFDKIAAQFEGFYYGRFDLKVRSIEEFNRGEKIRIFELNGVTSEPGHIYDTKYSLGKAYGDIMRELAFIYRISIANMKAGIQPYKASFIAKHIITHFRNKKA